MTIDFEKMLKESSHPLDEEPRITPKLSFLENVIYSIILGLFVSVMAGTIYLLWILFERTQLYPA